MDTIPQYIYDEIVELSDLSLQRKLWLNENNGTGLISSYVEVNCRLFDDLQFDNFIDEKAEEIGINSIVIIELKKLRDILNLYKPKNELLDEEIINDPNWKRVSEQAKIVLSKWHFNS